MLAFINPIFKKKKTNPNTMM